MNAMKCWVFVLFLTIYLLTMGGHLYSADDEIKAMIAEAIVDRQSVALPEVNMAYMNVGKDHLSYSPFPIGLSLTLIPPYLISKVLVELFPSIPSQILAEFCYSTINPVITALSCMVLFEIIRLIGYTAPVSVITTFIYGCCTIAFPYAKTVWAEPQATLCSLIGLYGVLLFQIKGKHRRLIWAGVAIGFGILTKYETVIYGLFFAWMIMSFQLKLPDRNWKRAIIDLIYYGLPVFVFCIATLAYNIVRFNDWRAFSHYGDMVGIQGNQPNPFLDSMEGIVIGIYLHLFSTGKGVFVFSPPAIMYYWAVRDFRSQHRDLTALSVILIAVMFISTGAFWTMSNLAWGERYFVSLTPYFILPLSALVAKIVEHRNYYMKKSLITVCVIGFLVQLLGVSINFQTVIDKQLANGEKTDLQVRSYDPEYSPVLLHLKEALNRVGDTWELVRLGRKPFLDGKLRQSGVDVSESVDQKAFRDVIRYHTYDYWFCYMYLTGVPAWIILIPMILLLLTLTLSGRRLIQILYQSEGSETERPISPSASEPARV